MQGLVRHRLPVGWHRSPLYIPCYTGIDTDAFNFRHSSRAVRFATVATAIRTLLLLYTNCVAPGVATATGIATATDIATVTATGIAPATGSATAAGIAYVTGVATATGIATATGVAAAGIATATATTLLISSLQPSG